MIWSLLPLTRNGSYSTSKEMKDPQLLKKHYCSFKRMTAKEAVSALTLSMSTTITSLQ